MLVALFGITNEGLNLFVNLVIVFLVFVYLALIAWTYFDARRRIDDDLLVWIATAAALFPIIGPLIYSIVRPPDFLEDARERDLEIRASELRVRQLEEQSCGNCGYPIERNFLRCPSCRARVKHPCETCGKPIDPRWTMCPYCETPQRRPEPRPRRAAEKPARAAGAPRGKQGARPVPRRAPAQGQAARGSRQARPAAQRQSSSGRQAAPAKPRTSADGGGADGAPRREPPGEEQPRPATAP